MLNQLMADAAEKQLGEAAAAAIADDDHPRIFALGHVHQRPCSVTVHQESAAG